jgi:hypothetical protein
MSAARRPDYARIAELEQELGLAPVGPALLEASRSKNICPTGHPLDPAPENAGRRKCSACERARSRERER